MKSLFIGSEGTLGIITTAVMKVFQKPQKKIVSLFSVSTPKDAVSCYEKINKKFGFFVQAYELISAVGIDFLEEKKKSFVLKIYLQQL